VRRIHAFFPALVLALSCSAAAAQDYVVEQKEQKPPPVSEYDNLPAGLLMSQEIMAAQQGQVEAPTDDQQNTGDSVMSMADLEEAYKKGQYATIVDRILPVAKSGYPQAQELLGIMYHYGQGFPRDPKASLEWLTKAAEAGRPLAQHHLAIINYLGDGTARDPVKALTWAYLAIAHYKSGAERDRAIQDRDNIAAQLTRRDRKRAFEIAQDWLTQRNDPAILEEITEK